MALVARYWPSHCPCEEKEIGGYYMEESYLCWLKEDEKEFLRRDATNCALLYRIQLFGLCHPCLG